MKKGIGPRGLGSPLKQTTKPKRKTKMNNVVLSPRQKAENELLEAKKKRVAERESPGRREFIDRRLGRVETTIKKKK
jgi:hypothetical protein